MAILAQQANRAPPLSPSPGRRLALAPRAFSASPQGGWNLRAIESALRAGHALAAWIGLCGCLTLLPAPASAAPLWLIATPDETARAASPIALDVVKPPALSHWPEALTLKLIRDGQSWEVELPGVGVVAAQDARRTYRGLLPAHVFGLVRVELGGVDSNRLVLLISAPEVGDQVQPMAQGSVSTASPPGQAIDPFVPTSEPALTANEPIYLAVGGRGGATARFQLSFKYRIFDPGSLPVAWFSPLAGLHFGYTQTSIWDVGAKSAPIRDTSFRPGLFWQAATPGEGLMPDSWRAGFEHESNGKDGVSSRSINTLFAQAVWRTRFSDGQTLTVAPKVYGYLEKENNPDIQRYRGYVDWNFRYGRDDSWLLAATFRRGTARHASAQLDLSYPLSQPLFSRTGSFLHFQLFDGYGETLLDYDVKRGTQARLGFSIVR